MIKSQRGTVINNKVEHYYFHATDRFNRRVGANINTYEVDFIATPDDAICGYGFEPGIYFGLHVWATRNSENYGAVQRDRYFKTAQERQAAIDKYLDGARKRAVKLALREGAVNG